MAAEKTYFVFEEEGKILGCGGINYFIDKGEARLSWDMVHPEFQGKGIGKQLTLYRVELLKKDPRINIIVVRTTQLVYNFYEKSGFSIEKTEKDYWARGFVLYQMKMKIKK
jgi:[ribosomal protein S18]-alanine N-acetyltransferase